MKASRRKWNFRLLALTVVYAIVTAGVLYAFLYHMNFSFTDGPSSDGYYNRQQNGQGSADAGLKADSVNSTMNSTVNSTANGIANSTANSGLNTAAYSPVDTEITGLPADADLVSFTYDGQYCVYRSKGALYVMDLQHDKAVRKISKGGVTDALLMNDRNIVIYFTSANAVYTYNIDSGSGIMQHTFAAGHGSVVSKADYSSLTGHVSFMVGSGRQQAVYYINMFKNLVRMPVRGPIENIVFTNALQAAYYTRAGTLYFGTVPVKGLEKVDTVLLGCDIGDNIYVRPKNDMASIYAVKGVSVIRTIRVPEAGYTRVYSNKSGVFLVYPDHLLDLSTNPAKKIYFDRKYDFDGLTDSHIYLKDGRGGIVIGNL